MSLLDKVIGWLQANPEKCISADQIADYFEVHRAKVATELSQAVREGQLGFEAFGGEDAQPVWYLPKSAWAAEHGLCSPGAGGERDAPGIPANQKKRLAQSYGAYDFTDLQIEDDVPLHEPKKLRPPLYKQLLDIYQRMQIGQSVLIPKCSAIRQAAALFNEQKDQHVVTRKADGEHMRVWRTQ
jgi:hypothetical protein